MSDKHISVLLHEAVDALQVQPGKWYVDGTFGRGGHTGAILEKGGKVVAFDVDAEAIEFGQKEFAEQISQGQLILVRENFAKLASELQRLEKEKGITVLGFLAGILFDFGVSSPQMESETRGFSFQYDADLDMRMDDRLGVKAKDLLALLSERQLTEVFRDFGGEREAKKIAKAIIMQREKAAIHTVGQLADLIEKVKREPRGHLNPSTKVFQALRILVNSELSSIEETLPQAYGALAPGGRLVTIGFHEGEDRIAKSVMRKWEHEGKGAHLTHEVVTPSAEELMNNTRARSAKLRIFEKKL